MTNSSSTEDFPLQIENDFQHKVMLQSFASPLTLASPKDVQAWRAAWMKDLTKWHSPYKLLIDVSQLTVTGEDTKESLGLMHKFFLGFFLRKAVAFGYDADRGHDLLPFPVMATEEDARQEAGIRHARVVDPTDFRASIQIQNHFRQHVMEVGFAGDVTISSPDQVATLKSKLTNALMQWHSKWSLLIDCTHLEVDPATHPEWEAMFRFLRGFFMKDVVGYSPKGGKESYPFEVFRARHRAAGRLEAEGAFSGDEADCRSRKSPAAE